MDEYVGFWVSEGEGSGIAGWDRAGDGLGDGSGIRSEYGFGYGFGFRFGSGDGDGWSPLVSEYQYRGLKTV